MSRSIEEFFTVKDLIEDVIETTGYRRELEAEGTDEAQERIENIGELLNKAAAYDENQDHETHSLNGFLEEVALVADIDSLEEDPDHVLMMTLHSAKGLEFPNVFLVGMEDGMFPSYMSITSEDPLDIEEERRLCYVGITRAMKQIYLTAARQRMVRGEIHYNRVSRFVEDIPQELFQRQENVSKEKEQPKTQRERAQTHYQQAREVFRTKAFVPQQFQVKKSSGLDYAAGDRVRHIKFGEGTVKNIVEGGRDYEVTVEFDRVGVKKMFASFAKLVKIS